MISSDIYHSDLSHQLLELRQAAAESPMSLLLYNHVVSSSSSAQTSARWVQRHSVKPDGICSLSSSLGVQKLLLRLLDSNAKRISPSYKPPRAPDEHAFTTSFILPTGAIDSREVGRFTLNACAICTTPATASCSVCRNVYYCGPGELLNQMFRAHSDSACYF